MFLLLSFLESTKNHILYVLKNQMSAAHPQPLVAKFVHRRKRLATVSPRDIVLASLRQALQNLAALQSQFLICENRSRNLDGSGVRCIAISFSSLLRDFLYSLLHNYAMSLPPASGKMPPSRTREDVSGEKFASFCSRHAGVCERSRAEGSNSRAAH
ncbi:MAG: hypothetical protein WB755_21905, partial [Terriglobales bacterium]